MQPRFRRFALVVATVGLLLSLFVALRPADDEDAAATTPTTSAETGTTATEAETAAKPPPATTMAAPREPAFDTVRVTVVGGRPQGGVKRVTIAQGRDVVLVVRADVSDNIHVHGYDVTADVAPGAPATLRFEADVPGRFEVELEERGIEIADLQVRP